MAKDQRNVEAITPMEVDFAKWYTDICLKAELVDYASVKGFMILRPYGYAIWENIQRIMDGMFKKTGHVNVAMPVLLPESLLKKEGETDAELLSRALLLAENRIKECDRYIFVPEEKNAQNAIKLSRPAPKVF